MPATPPRPLAYADAAEDYWTAGWHGVLPLPPGSKWPPPNGWTGDKGAYPSYPDVLAWVEDKADGNVALRLPDGVIGIDVDHYGTKNGGDTIAYAVAAWGELPPTIRTTSRPNTASGIRLYAVPAGSRLVAQLGFPDRKLGHVEIIQRHHRYAVVWPSVHPDGPTYAWRDDDGNTVDIPTPDELPALPEQWLHHLVAPASSLTDDAATDSVDVRAHLSAMPGGTADLVVTDRLSRAIIDLSTGMGSRHDTTTAHVLALLRHAEQGHPGVPDALAVLGDAFVTAVTTPGTSDTMRHPEDARAEFARMVTNPRGHALIATSPSTTLEQLAGVTALQPAASTTLSAIAEERERQQAAPPVQQDVEGMATTRTTWAPADLAAILSGEVVPETPTQLARADGHHLLYPGRINGLVGESESGKSWVAMHACVQAMRNGEAVVYLDHEDTAAGVVGRFRALGVADDTLSVLLTYISPDESLGPVQRADLVVALAAAMPTLIVVDGVNAALTLMGLDLDKNKDYTLYHQQVLKVLSGTGATVVTIDHVTKNKDTRGVYAIGAQAKRAMTDGAMIAVEAVTKFGRGQSGKLRLTVLKDRPGTVRSISGNNGWLGDVTIASGADGMVTMELCGIPSVDEARPVKPYRIMARISTLLDSMGDGQLNGKAIRDDIGGNAKTVDWARDLLAAEGYIERTEGYRGALLFRSVKRYHGDVSDLARGSDEG